MGKLIVYFNLNNTSFPRRFTTKSQIETIIKIERKLHQIDMSLHVSNGTNNHSQAAMTVIVSLHLRRVHHERCT